MMNTIVKLVTFLLLIYYCHCDILTGGRLGDFPPSKTIKLYVTTSGTSYYEVEHDCNKLPFLVNVYAYSQNDGDNHSYRFDGTGSCQNDGQEAEGYGGILFAYNEQLVRLWIPSHHGRDNSGQAIFVGEGWGGNTHSQSSSKAMVVIEIWENGPNPSFEKRLSFHTKSLSISLKHPLQMIPEFISVRVTAANRAVGEFYHFHATGSSQTAAKTLDKKTRRYGGIIFAYNDKKIALWGPNRKQGGCIAIGKRWGNGRESDAMFAQNCTIHIRLWVNSFTLPAFQSEWRLLKANEHSKSFVQIKHDLRRYPSLVKVQYRKSNNASEYIFEGIGSVQSTPGSTQKYGGIIYAYNKENVRLWLPTSSTPDQAYTIFVGNGWGDKDYFSESAEVRILLYVNMCKKNEIMDPLGICRTNSETHIEQKLTNWGKCSNPCGKGVKTRQVDECQGRSLKTVVSCSFERDFCNFQQRGSFKWKRTKGVTGSRHRQLKIPFDGFPSGSYFIYSDTASAKSIEYPRGSLISPMINEGGENCVLHFHYNSVSYFGNLKVYVMKSNGQWKDDLWTMKDSQVMSGLWRKGYINLGDVVDGPIRRFKFEQVLLSDTDSEDQRNPISLSNIELKCEKSKLIVLTKEKCMEKEITSTSCLIDVFKPYAVGPAWKVNSTKNEKKKSIGKFVVADGKEYDLIATYQFKVLVDTDFAVWVDSFALSNKTNGVQVRISDGESHRQNLIYNLNGPMWLPLGVYYRLAAGSYKIHFHQLEKGFRFRHLMIAPRKIKVWGSLGMQTQLIPDSSFSSLTGGFHYLVYSRLNGEAAWMPTDETKGRFYLQIKLPDVALINKIATQGGTWLSTQFTFPCSTDKYKIKFSLDGKFFSYYRNDTMTDEHEFDGNKGVNVSTIDSIMEHTLEYAIIARAIRFYPTEFKWSGCLRVELYGYFISDGMCPKIISNLKQSSCTGDKNCGNKESCQLDRRTNSSTCQCVLGYHGKHCNLTSCEENPCLNGGSCHETGYPYIVPAFFCDCLPGYHGDHCELECSAGTFGTECSEKCKCSNEKVCNPQTGSCSCEAGYYGNDCNEKCPHGTYGKECMKNCSCPSFKECDSVTGSCVCKDGYYGDNCDQICTLGFFGMNCIERCSCENGGHCDHVTGKCNCTMGWFGKHCQEKCPDNRWGKNCANICHHPKNSSCDHVTGHWTCNAGLYGAHCDMACGNGWYGAGCHSLCSCDMQNTHLCDKKNGKCRCKDGYEGERCEEKCASDSWGSNCQNKCLCKNGGECDHVTGNCTCLHGFRGNICDSECEKYRYGKDCKKTCNCTWPNTEKCEPSYGRCLCFSGYEGDICELKCSGKNWGKNCRETCGCKNGASCDHKTGFCDCQPGFQGQYCEERCNNDMWGLRCSKKCSCMNKALCDSVTGGCTCQPGFIGPKCQSICDSGWYGKNCLQECKCDEEKMESCNHTNGKCSCLPGYQGTKCERDCKDNTWGKQCSNTCFPCRHVNGACDKRYGNCSCSTGFIGFKCDQDCPADRYGDGCVHQCACDSHSQLCNNLNGECYYRTSHVITLDLLVDPNRFERNQYFFREKLEILFSQCFHQFRIALQNYPARNITDIPKCEPKTSEDAVNFIVRVISTDRLYTTSNQHTSAVTITVLNGSQPVQSSYVANVLTFIGADTLSKQLEFEYFTGKLFDTPQIKAWYEGEMKWVVIGLSLFGVIILTALGYMVIRCTKKIPQPSPFQKIKTDAKDIVELQPCLESSNSHLLAFENPYYDVIAAMGLDDDIEEDYYNPLYEMPSDSETEPDDVYFAYQNNRYSNTRYQYDKDSGFSSGTIM